MQRILACIHACALHVCLVLKEARESIGAPGTGVTESCEQLWECGELNLGPSVCKDYRRFEAGYSSMRIRDRGGENRKTRVSPLQKAKQPTAA